MDDSRFDSIARSLVERVGTRRGVVAGAVIAALSLIDADSKKKKKGKGKKRKHKKGKDICLPIKELCAGVTVCDTVVDDCRGARTACECRGISTPSDDHFGDCLVNGTCAQLCILEEIQTDENLPNCSCRATPDGQPLIFAARTFDTCLGPVCDAVTDCPLGQACWTLACGGRCVDVCTPSMIGL